MATNSGVGTLAWPLLVRQFRWWALPILKKVMLGFGNGRVIEILDNIYYVSDLPFCLLRLSSLNEFLAVEAVIGEPVSVLISLLCGKMQGNLALKARP